MKYLLVSIFLLSAFLLPAQDEHSGWFAFRPEDGNESAAFDLSHWLDKPAGKHGFLRFEGKDFVFEDGTPIKFWGVNIASNRPFIDAEAASRWTKFMTRYGINGVRFHKFTWDATDGENSTVITNEVEEL